MRGVYDQDSPSSTGKARAHPYAMTRPSTPLSSSKTTKAAMVRLERTADEMKKSRTFWWRIVALFALALVAHSVGIRVFKWPGELGDGRRGDGLSVSRVGGSRVNGSTGDVTSRADMDGEPVGADGEGGAVNVASLSDSQLQTHIEATRLKKWQNREVPEFCQSIFKKPIPFDKSCKRSGKNMTCANMEGVTMMFSQFHQDYYLYTKHFKFLKRRGVYMDVASNDAVGISNSYFFDACLGWRGVCVEGNPEYYERIYRLRTCSLVPTCVAKRDGTTVEFGLAGGAGGVLGSSHKHMQVWAERRKEVHTIKERCTTLEKIMDKEEYTVVDYLSLDVEGLELDVLQGIDWDRIKINVLTVEMSRDTIKGIEEYMKELGYKKHMPTLNEQSEKSGLLRDDAVFLHEDVVWGEPQ